MTDNSIRDAGHVRAGRLIGLRAGHRGQFRRSAQGWPGTWLNVWRASLLAEDAYGRARAHGASRDIAATQAFDALTRAETFGRTGDGGTEELLRRIVDSGHGEPLQSRQQPVRHLDYELTAAAVPRDDACARGDLRVAALCLALIAALIVLAFAASLGARGTT